MQPTSKRAACAVLVAALAQGCSLLVSTDGLSGSATAGDGGADGSPAVSSEGGAGSPGDAGGDDAASKTVLATTSRTDVLRVNATAPELPAMEINAGNGAGAVSKQTGIRFANVRIPKGAVIASATLHLVASENQADPMANTTLSWQSADDAAPWTGTFADFDGRPRGTRVPWPMIEAWAVGERHDTPDLAVALQEIVDRPGWVSGNAVVLFWSNEGSVTPSQRVAYTAGTSALVDPLLTIRLR